MCLYPYFIGKQEETFQGEFEKRLCKLINKLDNFDIERSDGFKDKLGNMSDMPSWFKFLKEQKSEFIQSKLLLKYLY